MRRTLSSSQLRLRQPPNANRAQFQPSFSGGTAASKVRTGQPSFGDDKPIIPGMTAEVDILTGKKTVLSYLLKPVLKAKAYALRER